jgi:3-phosphoshikimate 1-carboxyvinyltransferase
MKVTLSRTSFCQGRIHVPGDKSISHRSLLLGAIAQGKTRIEGLLYSEDVLSTWHCLQKLGVSIQRDGQSILITGKNQSGFYQPQGALDCGNSGTTARLLMGALAGYPLSCQFIGDASLSQRPMKRVATPLREMGAKIQLTHEDKLPLLLEGSSSLHGINYSLPIASAQLKSAVLLAGLKAQGKTVISGETSSRDHTERMLQYFGVKLRFSSVPGQTHPIISIDGGQTLHGRDILVPGDISSAAFWIALALLTPKSELHIENVLLNPSRLGIIHVLQRMGAKIKAQLTSLDPEPMGTLSVSHSHLVGTEILPHEVPSLIDEIPILSLVACHAHGLTSLRGAQELRFKETDRIEAIAHNLRAMGARIDTCRDGFDIEGTQQLKGAQLRSFGDHRIAMTFSIAAVLSEGESTVHDTECVSISYPHFFETLNALTKSPTSG